jgi:ATP-binding cassette subfamily F protein 3
LLPETGEVTSPSGSTIGYLPQEMVPSTERTVIQEALQAFQEVLQLDKKRMALANELAERTDYHSEAYLKLIERLHEAEEKYALLGGPTMQGDTEKVLLGLGFRHSDFARSMSEFSSGWQMRVELAKILLSRPNVLLLDEPTNHLDIEAITWMEEWLESYPGALVLVSHDRAFLDNVTTRTIEIMLGKIYDYKASYSDYVLLREEQREQQMSSYENQQRQIAQIERFVERFRYKSTKARQVQSRIKMLEKMDKIEVEDVDSSTIHFKFPPAPHSGRVMVETQKLGKSYGSLSVLENLEVSILKGEKVAFVGRNGEGKTTLSRIIVGDLDHSGVMTLGHNVSIGYFAQNQAALLDGEKTVFQTLDDVAVGDIRTRTRAILGSFLFGGEAIEKKVKVLSGGEKSRLALAKLLLTPVNLLVLDEPTNHLDMLSKDILKNALLDYSGSLIIVSHDRDFLQGLTTRVFEFKNRGIKEYIGDIYDFLAARKLSSLQQLEMAASANKGGEAEIVSDNKLNWEKKKNLDREKRKITNQIEKCEQEISRLEAEIASCDNKFAQPDLFPETVNSKAFFEQYNALKLSLDEEVLRWEDLHGQLDAVGD